MGDGRWQMGDGRGRDGEGWRGMARARRGLLPPIHQLRIREMSLISAVWLGRRGWLGGLLSGRFCLDCLWGAFARRYLRRACCDLAATLLPPPPTADVVLHVRCGECTYIHTSIYMSTYIQPRAAPVRRAGTASTGGRYSAHRGYSPYRRMPCHGQTGIHPSACISSHLAPRTSSPWRVLVCAWCALCVRSGNERPLRSDIAFLCRAVPSCTYRTYRTCLQSASCPVSLPILHSPPTWYLYLQWHLHRTLRASMASQQVSRTTASPIAHYPVPITQFRPSHAR